MNRIRKYVYVSSAPKIENGKVIVKKSQKRMEIIPIVHLSYTCTWNQTFSLPYQLSKTRNHKNTAVFFWITY